MILTPTSITPPYKPHYNVTSLRLKTIVSSILCSQFSTLSSAAITTLYENCTTSGIFSGSALIIAITSLLSSSSVNLILMILSKHFLRCA